MPTTRHVSLLTLFLMGASVAPAQRGGGDWMTAAFDAQRSNWVRNDGKISLESMQKPGFELVWKMKFANSPRQLNTLTPPALMDFYIGYRGFRALGFFGASADRIIGVDTDLARTEWEKSYPAGPDSGTVPCPGGQTSAVTRPAVTGYPAVPMGRGQGRGSAAKAAVGLPYEGAVTIRPTPVNPPPPPRPAPAPKPAGDAANPFAPRVQWVVALTGDGKLHMFWVSNGEEPNPPAQFVPAGANAQGLIVYDSYAYVSTSNGCGGADNGVWAMDLTSKKVTEWKAGANVAGTAGPAVGPDGTLYVAAGGEITALAPKTLEPKGSHKIAGVEFTSSPLVFEYRNRNLIAVTSNDGRLNVLDAAKIGNESAQARSEPFSAANYAAGALASWQDPSGTRWILAPSDKSITAWKVEMKAGIPTPQQAWVSRDLVSPAPPIVVNGVVFALGTGEFRPSDPTMTAAERAKRSTNAVLYALDPNTGKELWNSGTQINSFVHSGGLSAGGNKVYLGTFEGTQYAFGFPMEH